MKGNYRALLLSLLLLQVFYSYASAAPKDDSHLPESFYEVCDVDSSSCVGVPGDCLKHKNCTAAVGFQNGEFLTLAQSTEENNITYAALAFSEDQAMADDGIVECIKDNKNGRNLNVYLSVDFDRYKVARLDEEDQKGIDLISTKEENSHISCHFKLEKSIDFKNLTISLEEKDYYLMIAAGPTNTVRGTVTGMRHHSVKTVSKDKLSFKSGSSAIIASLFFICSSLLLTRVY